MQRLTESKKAILNQLTGVVTALVATGVVIVIGLLVMVETTSNLDVSEACNNASASFNKSGMTCTVAAGNSTLSGEGTSNTTIAIIDTKEAMLDITTWLGIIVIATIGSLLIGLVSLFRRRQR